MDSWTQPPLLCQPRERLLRPSAPHPDLLLSDHREDAVVGQQYPVAFARDNGRFQPRRAQNIRQLRPQRRVEIGSLHRTHNGHVLLHKAQSIQHWMGWLWLSVDQWQFILLVSTSRL